MSTAIPKHRRFGRWTRVAATAALASAALFAGATTPASAATTGTDPASTTAQSRTAAFGATSAYLAPGQSVYLATWFWGETTISVYNYGPSNARVGFSAPGSSAVSVTIGPGETHRQISRWWGLPVKVTNQSSTYVFAWSSVAG